MHLLSPCLGRRKQAYPKRVVPTTCTVMLWTMARPYMHLLSPCLGRRKQAYPKRVVPTTCTVMLWTMARPYMHLLSPCLGRRKEDLPESSGAHDLYGHGLDHGVDVHVLALSAVHLHRVCKQVCSVPHQQQEALQAAMPQTALILRPSPGELAGCASHPLLSIPPHIRQSFSSSSGKVTLKPVVQVHIARA